MPSIPDRRTAIALSSRPDGERLYTENEEDGTVSVIDLTRRKLLGKIKTPRPARRHRDRS